MLVSGARLLKFSLLHMKGMLNCVQIGWLTSWTLKNLPIFSFEKLLCCFRSMFGIAVELTASQWVLRFCLNLSRTGCVYTLQNKFCHCHQQVSSMTRSEPLPSAAVHAQAITPPPPCLADEVLCFGSLAVPSLFHTLLWPSLWDKLTFISSVHKTAFQNCGFSFNYYLNTNVTGPSCFCSKPVVCVLQCNLCIRVVKSFPNLYHPIYTPLPPSSDCW